jgi:hypothetical protein
LATLTWLEVVAAAGSFSGLGDVLLLLLFVPALSLSLLDSSRAWAITSLAFCRYLDSAGGLKPNNK